MSFKLVLTQTPSDDSLPIVLLDGGLGTTLEDIFHKDISNPLWSTKLVIEEEEVLKAACLQFLQAGSEVILTPTYQASYETFRQAGVEDADAERFMCRSVEIAAEAKKVHDGVTISESTIRTTKVGLSLGPFGATLKTAAEFTGIYPSPYGPGPSAQVIAQSLTPNLGRGPFTTSEESSYIDALSAFHFSRLLVYATNPRIWDMIDFLAFETIPLLLEAMAIRKAMFRLSRWFSETEGSSSTCRDWHKPWYISFVFPGLEGQFLQYRPTHKKPESTPTGDVPEPYKPHDISAAVFSSRDELAIPNGIGVNCTNVQYVSTIIEGYTEGFRKLDFRDDDKPWLVVYPNGGLDFDPEKHTWRNDASKDHSEDDWVEALIAVVGQVRQAKIFDGLFIGGCCKTVPKHIQLLKAALNQKSMS